MYKVGLTGGIGCGKSTLSNLFKQYTIPVIDADAIARTLVAPGRQALEQIQAVFGAAYINTNGSLKRSQLRDCIFQDAKKKQQLENIMHPLVYAEIDSQLNQLTGAYVIISVALLLETKMQALVDHILVIDCPMQMQVNRVKLRDNFSDAQMTAIINSQMSLTERLIHADSVIYNTHDITYLMTQVTTLHNQFLQQAQR